MTMLFYTAGLIAVVATLLAISRSNPVRALLYLIVSLLGSAGVMMALGAPFAAALEIMVYAGAIMVLFVFVVMLLNLGPSAGEDEKHWLAPEHWYGPVTLAGLLLVLLLAAMAGDGPRAGTSEVGAKAVGIALYGPYLLAVELGSFLLLAGLVAAYHIGRREELETKPK